MKELENESCSTTKVDPKIAFEPPKVKNYPKIKSKSKVRIKEKQFLKPTPNPKHHPLGPQKVKSDPKIKSKSNIRIKKNKENESCSTT